MNDRTYMISMHTPVGIRHGTISLRIDQKRVTGQLNILRHCKPFEGTIDEFGNCRLHGSLTTLMRTVPYTAAGHIGLDTLNLSLTGERNSLHIAGVIQKKVRTI